MISPDRMRFLQRMRKSFDEGRLKPSEILKYPLTDEEMNMFFRELITKEKEDADV